MTIGTFGTYEAPEKVNPYTETIEALAKATEDNPKAAWTLELDAAKETVERVRIAEAANKIGKTASLKKRDDSQRTVLGNREKSGNPVYGGKVILTFVLVPMHAQRRGKNSAENAEVEAPAEDTAKAPKK